MGLVIFGCAESTVLIWTSRLNSARHLSMHINQWIRPYIMHLIQNQCCCLGTTKRSLNSHQTLFLVRGYFWAQAYFHPFPSSHFPWSFCSHYVDCFSLSMTSVNALATLLEAFFNILGQQTDTSLNPGYYFTPAALDALLPGISVSTANLCHVPVSIIVQ